MGAETFTHYADSKDIKKAFKQAVDEAAWDYGHAGYTGTIAEKDSYVVIDDEGMTSIEAEALADELINQDDPRIEDKWGPAGAIKVVEEGKEGWLFFGWASS